MCKFLKAQHHRKPPTNVFETPTPSTVDPNLKIQLGNLCQYVAQEFSQLAFTDPRIPEERKHALNETFGAEDINAALMPDEICRGSADLLCAHLHAIGELFRTAGFISPAIIAPQARTVLENAALIHFLCDCDDELRVARAMRTLREKMKKEGAYNDEQFARLHEALCDVISANANFNRGKQVRTGDYRELVEREFDTLLGSEIYKDLSGWSHHNAWIAYLHQAQVTTNPTGLELEAIDLTACVLQITLVACRKLVPFRPDIEEIVMPRLETVLLELANLMKNMPR